MTTLEAGTERTLTIARQGGSVVSPEKKLSAQLRGLRLAKTTEKKNQIIQKISNMLCNPLLAESELLLLGEQLKNENLNINQKIKLLETLTKVHTTVFGSKNYTSVQQNISVNKPFLAERLLDQFLGVPKVEEEKKEILDAEFDVKE